LGKSWWLIEADTAACNGSVYIVSLAAHPAFLAAGVQEPPTPGGFSVRGSA
jgi:hypothetical protein